MNENTPATASDVAYIAAQRKTFNAYMWWLFLGAFGAHNFYLGRKGLGVLYLLTLGLLGFGLLFDLFALPSRVRRRNEEIAAELGATR